MGEFAERCEKGQRELNENCSLPLLLQRMAVTAITAIEDPNLRLLSAAQLDIWFAQMLNPHSPAYNIGEYLEIVGPIDPGIFETALRRVVAESDALQLRFIETDDGPRQYIKEDSDWLMPIVDVSAEIDPRAAAEAWMRDDMVRIVDLAHGPLFGYALFRVAPDRFFWSSRYHHLCNDGFGLSLVAQRLSVSTRRWSRADRWKNRIWDPGLIC